MSAGHDAAVAEIRRCGREVMLSNHTMEEFSERATPGQATFLLEMFHAEIDYREENKRRRLLKKASFPVPKSFQGYDWSGVRLPDGLGRDDLESCSFVTDARNLVLFGPVGTGNYA